MKETKQETKQSFNRLRIAKIIGISAILILLTSVASMSITEEKIPTTPYYTPIMTYYISTNVVNYGNSFTDISCNSGDQVISGGGDAGFNNGGDSAGSLRESRPISSNTWRVASVNRLGQNIQTRSASAVCVHIGR